MIAGSLELPCPTCKVPPGFPCVESEAGRTSQRYAIHPSRVRKANDYTRRMAKKRGYSREFTPKTERRVQIVIDRVPPTLKEKATAKAKREGISLRALILGWLKDWVEKET